MNEIPEDIMKAAENALDNLLCNGREAYDSTEAFRLAAIEEIAKPILAERQRNDWHGMETAPKDGKHCLLAVPEDSGFIYSVQGAYQNGQWNAIHRSNVRPIYWMPNRRLPSTAPTSEA